ncbi:MAG TPA: DUF2784 family protein [Fimbriimonadaceae bacterium]|jgi:hypothetical protein
MLAIGNVFFFIFHTVLIFFNVFGWLWKPTRKWNLATLLLTAVSWGIMGIWKGAGYCICTDWHWQIRRAMGIRDNADSYLVLLVQKISGWNPPISLVNNVALAVFVISLVGSVYTNVRDLRMATRPSKPSSSNSM